MAREMHQRWAFKKGKKQLTRIKTIRTETPALFLSGIFLCIFTFVILATLNIVTLSSESVTTKISTILAYL